MSRNHSLTAAIDWISNQTWPDAKHLIENHTQSSYVHPYGFIVVRTDVAYLKGWHVRVHFWPPETEPNTSGFEVHSHGWDMVSKVLVGELRESSYSARRDPTGLWSAFNVSSTVSTGSSTLKKLKGHYSVDEVLTTLRNSKNNPHTVETGNLHSTSPGSPHLSVSLALTSTLNTESSYVLSQSHLPIVQFERASPPSFDGLISISDNIYATACTEEDQWAAFVFIFDQLGRIAMARTVRNPNYWMPIGGRAKSIDDSPIKTAIRETLEELNITVAHERLIYLGKYLRDIGSGYTHFWRTSIQSSEQCEPDMTEFAEFGWFHPNEIGNLNTFNGTQKALELFSQSRPYLRYS